MFRRISFIWQMPKTIRMLCYGLMRATSAGEFYSQCVGNLPAAARYYLQPWFQALHKGNGPAVSREAERLWKIFRRYPVVRAFVNLTFVLPHVWEWKSYWCDLLLSLGNLPKRFWFFGNVPDELIYREGSLMQDAFTGLDQIQLLIYQNPCGRRGRRLRSRLDKVLRMAGCDSMAQATVLGEIVEQSQGYGEMNAVLCAALALFHREQEDFVESFGERELA